MAERENLAAGIGEEDALARLLEMAAMGFEEERLPEADTDEAADGAASRLVVEDGLRRFLRVRHLGVAAFHAAPPVEGGGGIGAGQQSAAARTGRAREGMVIRESPPADHIAGSTKRTGNGTETGGTEVVWGRAGGFNGL
jgi:hypothetical protein